MKIKPLDKLIIRYLCLAAGLVLIILYFGSIWGVAATLWNIVRPLLLGFVVAYILNILMMQYERLYFPKSKKIAVQKSRRLVCLLLSLVTIVLIVLLIIRIVLPQVVNTMATIAAVFPGFVNRINQWITENQAAFPSVAERMGEVNINWESLVKNIASYATRGISNIFSSSFSIIGVVTSGLFDAFVAFAFAVYLLLGKERLMGQLQQVQKAFMGQTHAKRLNHVLHVANESFTSFITGQCAEAVILGLLCATGMWLFRFPYAATVGVFVGATALIPILGAYLGAGVGAFLILVVDPVKAVLFIVYILVLQQLENNIIYPRVVGTSIGLPGVWVLVAVVIGGGMGGVIGMMLGVPVMATLYKLLRSATKERLAYLQNAANTK